MKKETKKSTLEKIEKFDWTSHSTIQTMVIIQEF